MSISKSFFSDLEKFYFLNKAYLARGIKHSNLAIAVHFSQIQSKDKYTSNF